MGSNRPTDSSAAAEPTESSAAAEPTESSAVAEPTESSAVAERGICVYCSSSDAIDARYLELAAQVGARIAAEGFALVSGGGRVSMMGAVARAARAGGARTVGVIPSHLMLYEVGDHDADELVIVETMRERKRIMDERSVAFIALPGGIGTLEEFFEVWTSRTLGMHPKPVVVLDPFGFYDALWAFLESLGDQGFMRPEALGVLHRVSSVDAAFAVLAELDRT